MHELKKQFFKIEAFKLKRNFQFLSAEQVHGKVSASWESMMSINSRIRKQANAENPKTNLKKLINSAKKSLELKENNNFMLKIYSVVKTKEASLHSSKCKTQNKFFKTRFVNANNKNLQSNENDKSKYNTKVFDLTADSPVSSRFEDFYKKHGHKKIDDKKITVENGSKYLSKMNTPIRNLSKLVDRRKNKDGCNLLSSKRNLQNNLNKTSKLLQLVSPEISQHIINRSIEPVENTSDYDGIQISSGTIFKDNVCSKKQLSSSHFNMLKSNESIECSPAPDAVVPSFSPNKNKAVRGSYVNAFNIDETPDFNEMDDDDRELFHADEKYSVAENSKISKYNGVDNYTINDKIFDEAIKSRKKSYLRKDMVSDGISVNETTPTLNENTPFHKNYTSSYRFRGDKIALFSPQKLSYKSIAKKGLFIENNTPVTTQHNVKNKRKINLMQDEENLGNKSSSLEIMKRRKAKDQITKRALFNLKTRLLDDIEIIENHKTDLKTDEYNVLNIDNFDNSSNASLVPSPTNKKMTDSLVNGSFERSPPCDRVVQNSHISFNGSKNNSLNGYNESYFNHVTTPRKYEDQQELSQFACTGLKWNKLEEDDLITFTNQDELVEDEDIPNTEKITEDSKNLKHEIHKTKKKKQVKRKKAQKKSKLASNPLLINGCESMQEDDNTTHIVGDDNHSENNVIANLEGEDDKYTIVGNNREREAIECEMVCGDVLLNDEQVEVNEGTGTFIEIKKKNKNKNIESTSKDLHNANSMITEPLTKETPLVLNVLSLNTIDEIQLEMVPEQLDNNMPDLNDKLSIDHDMREHISCDNLDNKLVSKTIHNAVREVLNEEFSVNDQATCVNAFVDDNHQDDGCEMEGDHDNNHLLDTEDQNFEDQNDVVSDELGNDSTRLIVKPLETKVKRSAKKNRKTKRGKTRKVGKASARTAANKKKQIQDNKVNNDIQEDACNTYSSDKCAGVFNNEENDNAFNTEKTRTSTIETVEVDEEVLVAVCPADVVEKPKKSKKSRTKKIIQPNAIPSNPDIHTISLQSSAHNIYECELLEFIRESVESEGNNIAVGDNSGINSNHNSNYDHCCNEVIETIKTPQHLKGNVTDNQLHDVEPSVFNENGSQSMTIISQNNKMASNVESLEQITECDLINDEAELTRTNEICDHFKQIHDTINEEICIKKDKKKITKSKKSKRKISRKKVNKNNCEVNVDNIDGGEETTFNSNANITSTASKFSTAVADVDMIANKDAETKNDVPTMQSPGKICGDKNDGEKDKWEINLNGDNRMEQVASDPQEAIVPIDSRKEMICNINDDDENDGQNFMNDQCNKEFDIPNEDVAINNLNRSNNFNILNTENPERANEIYLLPDEDENIVENINNKNKNVINKKVNLKKQKTKSKINKNKKRKSIQSDASKNSQKIDNFNEDKKVNDKTVDNEININIRNDEMTVEDVSCNVTEVLNMHEKINNDGYEMSKQQTSRTNSLYNINNEVDIVNINAENVGKINKTHAKDDIGNEMLNGKGDDDNIIADERVDSPNNPFDSHSTKEISSKNSTIADVNDENCIINNELSKKHAGDGSVSDAFYSYSSGFNNNEFEVVTRKIKSSFKLCLVASMPEVVNKDDIERHCMNLLPDTIHVDVPVNGSKNSERNKESDDMNHEMNHTTNVLSVSHEHERFNEEKRLANASSTNQPIEIGINNNENIQIVDNSARTITDNNKFINNNTPKRSILNKDDLNSPEHFHPNALKKPKCSSSLLQNINYATSNTVADTDNDNDNCNNSQTDIRKDNINKATNNDTNTITSNDISNTSKLVDLSQANNEKSDKTCSEHDEEAFNVYHPSQAPQHYTTRSSVFHYYVTKYIPLSQKSDSDENDDEASPLVQNNRNVNSDQHVETNTIKTANDNINSRGAVHHKASINSLTLTNDISCTNNVINNNPSNQNNTAANETNLSMSKIPLKKRRVSFSGLTIVNIHSKLPSSYDGDSLEGLENAGSQEHMTAQNINNVAVDEVANAGRNDVDGAAENIRKSILKKSSRFNQIIDKYENVGNNCQYDHHDDVVDDNDGDTNLEVSLATCDESFISENPYINLQGPYDNVRNDDNDNNLDDFSQSSFASSPPSSLCGSSSTALPSASSASMSSLPVSIDRKVSVSCIEMTRYDDRDMISNDISLMREMIINEFKEKYSSVNNNNTHIEINNYDHNISKDTSKIYQAPNNAKINSSLIDNRNNNNSPGLLSSTFNIQTSTCSADMLQNETNPFALLNEFQSSFTSDNNVNEDDNTSTRDTNVNIENVNGNTRAKNITNTITHDIDVDINYISNMLGNNPLPPGPSFSLSNIPSDIVDMKIDYDEKDLEALFKHLPDTTFEKITEKTGWADDLYD